jgi:ABC-type anion transport system duplicated permease subunit
MHNEDDGGKNDGCWLRGPMRFVPAISPYLLTGIEGTGWRSSWKCAIVSRGARSRRGVGFR